LSVYLSILFVNSLSLSYILYLYFVGDDTLALSLSLSSVFVFLVNALSHTHSIYLSNSSQVGWLVRQRAKLKVAVQV
ncbi:hypothetical protein JQN64_27095, partial [Escherichia coli]|nr:hypothetical protein [Escherichia coli]